MNPIEHLLAQARAEQAAASLSALIVSTRHRKQVARRLAVLSGIAGTAVVATALFPKPAYAGLEQSIQKTLAEPVIRVLHWRNIRGRQTIPEIITYGKNRQKIEGYTRSSSDDGKIYTEYWGDLKHAFVDKSDHQFIGPMTKQDLLIGAWKTSEVDEKAEFKGQRATCFKATKTYSDGRKGHSYETTVYSEPNKGRLLYAEVWRDDHSWGDAWEYTYPPDTAKEFALELPKETAITDLRDVREDLKKRAARTRPSKDLILLGAYVGPDGGVGVVTLGGAPPNPYQPQSIWINGKRTGTGDMYGYGFSPERPPILYGLHGNPNFQSTAAQGALKGVGSRADVTVYSWKKKGKLSVPDRKVTFKDVPLQLIPSPYLALRRLFAKPKWTARTAR